MSTEVCFAGKACLPADIINRISEMLDVHTLCLLCKANKYWYKALKQLRDNEIKKILRWADYLMDSAMGSLASDLVWGLVNFGRESRELVYLIIEALEQLEQYKDFQEGECEFLSESAVINAIRAVLICDETRNLANTVGSFTSFACIYAEYGDYFAFEDLCALLYPILKSLKRHNFRYTPFEFFSTIKPVFDSMSRQDRARLANYLGSEEFFDNPSLEFDARKDLSLMLSAHYEDTGEEPRIPIHQRARVAISADRIKHWSVTVKHRRVYAPSDSYGPQQRFEMPCGCCGKFTLVLIFTYNNSGDDYYDYDYECICQSCGKYSIWNMFV